MPVVELNAAQAGSSLRSSRAVELTWRGARRATWALARRRPIRSAAKAEKRDCGVSGVRWDRVTVTPPVEHIEARVSGSFEQERFDETDFVRAPDGSLRLSPDLLRVALNACAPSSCDARGLHSMARPACPIRP